MAERSALRLWAMRGLFAGLCLALIFLRLLPLETLPRSWAGPDVMLALTCAWVLRRPEFAPPVAVAALFLLADFLFQRPPGLWAGLVLVGTEALKARAPALRDLTFAAEWFNVAMLVTALTLAKMLVLALLLVGPDATGLMLLQLSMTVVVYPVVVLASEFLFGVRKAAPGDIDSQGQRI
ncbi:rod shape-determining protein MreD [Roseovarius salinarum]|uniref:rod shape-determining protein MreD n=1 Tax=Roseovarius salinarum TaxID=1981892 RepID=UPI000C33FCF2|nr:rod shape-determining protein MreD [Roseovarius salinarum]